jgi:hypothetical protein
MGRSTCRWNRDAANDHGRHESVGHGLFIRHASSFDLQSILSETGATRHSQKATRIPKESDSSTHAIKKQNKDGSVEVTRVRFKTF